MKESPGDLIIGRENQGGKLMMIVAEGESVAGPILQIGNTNSRYRFAIGARKFVNDWNQQGPGASLRSGSRKY